MNMADVQAVFDARSTPPSCYQLGNSSELLLQRFGVVPVLQFTSSAVGVPTTHVLRAKNPNPYALSVEVVGGETHRGGFTIDSAVFSVPALGTTTINVRWTPSDTATARLQLQLKAIGMDDSGRPVKLPLVVTLLASVVVAPSEVSSSVERRVYQRFPRRPSIHLSVVTCLFAAAPCRRSCVGCAGCQCTHDSFRQPITGEGERPLAAAVCSGPCCEARQDPQGRGAHFST
jgi:hypothetical protein